MINSYFHTKYITAVTLLCSCFFMASCENNINEVKAMGNNKGGIDIGKDVAIYMSDGGRMTAKMMAPVMKKYLLDSGQMVEFPNTINVDFYKDSAIVNSKMSANYAKYIQEENLFFLKGDVIVYTTQGDTLWCKEMYWDQKTNKFHRVVSWEVSPSTLVQHQDRWVTKGEQVTPEISLSMYLTDDYEGGELSFSTFGKKIKPSAGDIVVFDSNTLHGTETYLGGRRMTIQCFLFKKEGGTNDKEEDKASA